MKLPAWAAVFHGLAGATGFALLLVTVIGNPALTLARRALLILVVAVFLGCVNVVFHIRGIRHRTMLVVGHALLAVTGVTTLAFALATRPAIDDRPPARDTEAPPVVRPPRAETSPLAASAVVPSAALPSAAPPTTHVAPPQSGDVLARVVRFAPGSTVIAETSLEDVEHMAEALRARSEIRLVEVAGHTDARGYDGENALLALSRARAVVRTLVRHGVEAGRLRAVSYGAECPSDVACRADPSRCQTEEAWERDRRVVLTLRRVGDERIAADRSCAPVTLPSE